MPTPYRLVEGNRSTSEAFLKVMTANIAHGRGNSVVQKLLKEDTVKDNLEFIADVEFLGLGIPGFFDLQDLLAIGCGPGAGNKQEYKQS